MTFTGAAPGSPSVSPAPTGSDRKLSKSPYLSLDTVQETGELEFSDFERRWRSEEGYLYRGYR